MVLIDLNDLDLMVINKGLTTLKKSSHETSELNNIQATVENIQRQLNELKNWPIFWKEMNPTDRKVIDRAFGEAFFTLQKNIDGLDISFEMTEIIKKIKFRCEYQMQETPTVVGCVPDL